MTKKLGLALGCGGWRGLVHAGVIKSLEKNHIKIDYLAGSSIGAIIGGLYAVTGKIETVEEIIGSIGYKNIFRVVWDKPLRKKNGLIDGQEMDKFFRKIVGDIKIEDLKIPFRAVCADLYSGKLVAIDKVYLVLAMRASAAIPVLLKAVEWEGKTLIDGGAISPVPCQVCKDMGADVVAGVSLYGGIFPIKKKGRLTKLGMAKMARFLPLKTLADHDLMKADVIIEPKIEGEDYGLLANLVRNKGVMDCGVKETDKKIEEIKALLG